MVFCLSVSMLWGQDSLPAESQKGDVFIANNSFHVVGNALVLGNIKSIENKEDAKNEKQKQLLVQKKSNDNIKIFKEKRARKVVALPIPKFFLLPIKSDNSVSSKIQSQLVLVISTDSNSCQKGKSVLAKFKFNLQNYTFNEVLVCNSDYSEGYKLGQHNQAVVARPPPDIV